MNQRVQQIGFSQRVRYEWLEQTTNLLLAGNDDDAIYKALQETLSEKVSVGGNAKRGNKEKIITILLKIWNRVPSELKELRDEGLNLLQRFPGDHLAIHWGMTMAVYPFWGAVAASTGRLLNLQGTVAASHVQRRLREQYGERETVSRAARRVLRTFYDWGVLVESGKRGVYSQGETFTVTESKLIAWLAEALLHAREQKTIVINDVLESMSLFPFDLAHISAAQVISENSRLDVLRHGMTEEMLILKDSLS